MKLSKRLSDTFSKEEIIAHRVVFDKLRGLHQKELENNLRSGRKKEHYFLPAWSEYQADRLGTQRTLQEVIDLLTIED